MLTDIAMISLTLTRQVHPQITLNDTLILDRYQRRVLISNTR